MSRFLSSFANLLRDLVQRPDVRPIFCARIADFFPILIPNTVWKVRSSLPPPSPRRREEPCGGLPMHDRTTQGKQFIDTSMRPACGWLRPVHFFAFLAFALALRAIIGIAARDTGCTHPPLCHHYSADANGGRHRVTPGSVHRSPWLGTRARRRRIRRCCFLLSVSSSAPGNTLWVSQSTARITHPYWKDRKFINGNAKHTRKGEEDPRIQVMLYAEAQPTNECPGLPCPERL